LSLENPRPPIDITPLRGDHGLWVHGDTVWFTAEGSKAIATLDPATRRLESVVGTGQDKTHLVWVSRDGTRVLASNAASATLSVFHQVILSPVMTPGAPPPPASYTQPAWEQQLVSTGPGAEGFAVSPDESEAWVGDSTGAIVIVDIATARVKEHIQPGVPGANRLKFTPDGGRVLVTMHTGKELVVLDSHTHAVVARIPIEERGASGIAIQPDGKRVFIACPRDHYVAVVDLSTLQMTAKIDAGREPDGLAWWGR
jgi:YVTN family beta-propeller protein